MAEILQDNVIDVGGEEVVAAVGKVLALEARRPLSLPASPPTRSWSTDWVCGVGVE
jgi:hypothetical protein